MNFLETIRFEKKQFHNLQLHQKRIDKTFKNFFPNFTPFKLDTILSSEGLEENKTYKIKLEYSEESLSQENTIYKRKEHKSFLLLPINFDYSYKFADRNKFLKLKKAYNEYDEFILIKDKEVCDSTYSNLIFFNGEEWITPKKTLLSGTMRELLLSKKQIKEKAIKPEDLKYYSKFKFINALNSPEESFPYSIQSIVK